MSKKSVFGWGTYLPGTASTTVDFQHRILSNEITLLKRESRVVEALLLTSLTRIWIAFLNQRLKSTVS